MTTQVSVETETSITAIIGIGCCSSFYHCHAFLIYPCMLLTLVSFQKESALPCPGILSRKQWMDTQVLRSTGPETWNPLKSRANLWRCQPVQMLELYSKPGNYEKIWPNRTNPTESCSLRVIFLESSFKSTFKFMLQIVGFPKHSITSKTTQGF